MSVLLLLSERECDIYPDRKGTQIISIFSAFNPKFNIGDKVEIDPGFCYAYYRAAAVACGFFTLAESMKLKTFHVPSGGVRSIGTILSMCKHENESTNIYAVKLTDGRKLLIGEKGIKLIQKGSYIAEDLFEL